MAKVLVVEDTKTFQNLIQTRIKRQTPYQVEIADSLQRAQEILDSTSESFLVAICDLGLPDAPRGEVVDAMQSRGIPVIVMTGHFEDEIRDRINAKNIFEYILKEGTDNLAYLLESVRRVEKNQTTKVLLVEDPTVSGESARNILQCQLFRILKAGSGAEALGLIEENPDIRLLIVDNHLAGMDGYEFVANVRRKFQKDKMAIIVVSGWEEERILPRFLKIGANDFLKRPYNREEFICRINGNLDSLDLIERSQELARKDFLTGLNNRMYFLDLSTISYSNMARAAQTVAMGLADIDHFKEINDTLGHDAGDFCLKHMAKILSGHMKRKSDIVARLGGDEFCFLISYDDRNNLTEYLNRIVATIRDSPVTYEGHTVSISASIGVCTKLHQSLEEMIKCADKFLYEAKRQGRNRAVVE